MNRISWIDGWMDSAREPGEGDMVAVADGVRYRIPLEVWIDEGLKSGDRISFTLHKKRKNARLTVDKVILRP